MVQFLKYLLTIFRGSAQKSAQREIIEASEQIARYIFSSKQYSINNGRVKYGAYLPAPNGEVSVYRISGLSEEEIWKIGREYVAKPRGKTLYARGDTTAAVITRTRLDIVAETTPHPLHANIINWPSEKGEQKMLALEIANEAKLAVPPG